MSVHETDGRKLSKYKRCEAIKYTHAYDDLAFAAGDGVVLVSAAMLPRGYRCVKDGKVETGRGHVGLLGDVEAVGKTSQAIIDTRAKGVGLGTDHPRRSGNCFVQNLE